MKWHDAIPPSTASEKTSSSSSSWGERESVMGFGSASAGTLPGHHYHFAANFAVDGVRKILLTLLLGRA